LAGNDLLRPVKPILRQRNKNHWSFGMILSTEIDSLGALKGWMDTLVRFVRSDQTDLTNRQMGILMLVYMVNGPHTVRGLAAKLAVSKPVVTRALNTLGALGYIRRKRDDSDLRNIFVERTQQGLAFLESFARLIDHGDTNQPPLYRDVAAFGLAARLADAS
jgi:DNA-binding MarR family transcriptional regulator